VIGNHGQVRGRVVEHAGGIPGPVVVDPRTVCGRAATGAVHPDGDLDRLRARLHDWS